MNRYEKTILDRLLDKYEHSKTFVKANRQNQSFLVKPEQLFAKYRDDSEYELFRDVNDCIVHLEALGYVTAKRQKNGVVVNIRLITEHLDSVYRYIERVPKSDVVTELARLLTQYQDSNAPLNAYCRHQFEQLENNKPVEYFDGDLKSYHALLEVVSRIFDVENETFERDFSVRVLGDSKAFEKLRDRVTALLYKYGDFPERETLLADLNLVRNPGHVYFKGQGKISLRGQVIDFSSMRGDLALSSDMLADIDNISVFGSAVVTIENLTTFNSFNCNDSFAIYLGGYHNQCRRRFIMQVHAQNPDKLYLHFGDIDAGGFYILRHLRDMTGIRFMPYRMDVETLKANLKYTKPLTENDRKRLLALVDSEFGETVSYMLEHNCKLEQEATDLLGNGI